MSEFVSKTCVVLQRWSLKELFQTKYKFNDDVSNKMKAGQSTYIHTHYASSVLQIIQCCVLPCLIRINIQVQPSILKVGYLETHTYTSWRSFCHRLHCYGVFGVWDGSSLVVIAHHLPCYGMFAGSHHQHHERRRHEPKRPFPPRPPFITKRWWKGSFFAFHNLLFKDRKREVRDHCYATFQFKGWNCPFIT